MQPAQQFDGVMPQWHHASSVFHRDDEIKSLEEGDELEDLRAADLQHLRKHIKGTLRASDREVDEGKSVAPIPAVGGSEEHSGEYEIENAKSAYAADLESIREARERIAAHIHITPVMSSGTLDEIAGCRLFFKCELLQKGGAFKFRGACNAVLSLSDEDAEKGVLTHSSGNHAAAVALAARMRGIPAYIVMPNNAPTCKLENVERYGGHVTICEPTLESRELTAARVQEETGAALIHPFNDPRIISGQGTVALEFLEQVPQLDVIVVPISGGGLISGIALAAKALKPKIQIIAAEPSGADDAAQSKTAGHVIPMLRPNTIADGLRASLGDLTWPVVRDLVSEVITVDDKDIIEAAKLCFEVLKLAVEPSGAIGLAVLLSHKSSHLQGKNVGIVLSGGNVDLGSLWAAWKQKS